MTDKIMEAIKLWKKEEFEQGKVDNETLREYIQKIISEEYVKKDDVIEILSKLEFADFSNNDKRCIWIEKKIKELETKKWKLKNKLEK